MYHYRITEDLGVPMTTQKITPGDVATGISTEIWKYVERTVAYTSGGTTEIKAGDVVVGATSSAYAVVKSLTLTSGTWAGGNAAGVLTLCGQVGTFQSENLKVGAGTNECTIGANSTAKSTDYRFKNALAKSAIVTCEDNDQRFAFTGVTPDQTSDIGHVLAAGNSYTIGNEEAIMRFKTIDKTSGSAGTVRVTCFF